MKLSLRPKGSDTTDCWKLTGCSHDTRIRISPPARKAALSEIQTREGSDSTLARFIEIKPWIVD
ncbi:MAG: hypothetical protein R3D26_18780 [Cyanobacteriota/Melainabacteria group bacterium]